MTGDPALSPPPDLLLSSVERLQDELAALRTEVNRSTAPLSMGQRVDAGEHLKTIAASLGNLKRTLKRKGSGC